MLYTKFQLNRPVESKEEDFKDFYHIWAWRPSWSYDQDHLSKLPFPYPKEDLHEISIGQAVSEKVFKMLTPAKSE